MSKELISKATRNEFREVRAKIEADDIPFCQNTQKSAGVSVLTVFLC